MDRTVAQSFEPTFPTKLWHIYQQTCDNMLRTHSSVEGFHHVIKLSYRYAFCYLETDTSMKEAVLANKEKV